jgi:2,3-diketo-5-methylthiopentyl-1-phosphate enolase
MSGYRNELYNIYEGVNHEDYLIATYIVGADTKDFLRLSGEIAAEQTTGSWLPVPLETPELMACHSAQVINAFEVPDYTYWLPGGKRQFVVEIAFPVCNFSSQIPMLLSTVIGNISLMGELKLVDLKLPKGFVEGFPGPQFGIEGMRKYLNVPKRPLINNMIKPCTGLTPKQSADLFYEVAMGGVDIVKDDELIANAGYSSVAERVKLCMAMEKRAFEETGEHTYYAINITDNPHKVMENARAALDAGANMLMLNTHTAGFGTLQMLAESKEVNVPLLSHPDYAGAVAWPEKSGVSAHLILGKFLRLCGADISVYPTNFGKLPINIEQVVKIVFALQSPLYGMKGVMPMPSGGMTQGMVQLVMADMGNDIVIGAGAAVHAHPMGPRAGGLSFRQAVDVVLEGKSLREGSKQHKELAMALDLWGIPGEEEKAIFGLKK